MQLKKITAIELIGFIQHELLLDKDEEMYLDATTDLVNAGIIDSLTLIQLVTHIESVAGIKIDDDEVNPDNFKDIASIVAFIDTKITKKMCENAI